MCGFVGMIAAERVAGSLLLALQMLQHRGQDAAGLGTWDDGRLHLVKGVGMITQAIPPKSLPTLKGDAGISHVRYPTAGAESTAEDAQPFRTRLPGILLAHNGNVTNFTELKHDYFGARGVPLASDCDLEAVLYVFADKLSKGLSGPNVRAEDIYAAVGEVFARVRGAYSVVGVIPGAGMFAFRDPYGIKPAVLGVKETPEGKSYAIASESVVLDVAGYKIERDLRAHARCVVTRVRNVFLGLTDLPCNVVGLEIGHRHRQFRENRQPLGAGLGETAAHEECFFGRGRTRDPEHPAGRSGNDTHREKPRRRQRAPQYLLAGAGTGLPAGARPPC